MIVNMNQRPISTAWSPASAKIVGSNSSLIPMAIAVSGRSISTQVVSRVGPSSGRRAM
jgi:hypothetical protein